MGQLAILPHDLSASRKIGSSQKYFSERDTSNSNSESERARYLILISNTGDKANQAGVIHIYIQQKAFQKKLPYGLNWPGIQLAQQQKMTKMMKTKRNLSRKA